MQIQLTDVQRDLIERMGMFNEEIGLPPAESRVLALLTVCDESELTFDQIRELLQISKSATSNALHLLTLAKHVTYKTKPGDRKRYFYSNMMHWEENISEEMGKILKVTDLLKEALAMRSSNTPEFNGKLAEFIEFLEYLGEEMPLLFTKWKQRNTATHTNSNKHES